MEKRSNIVIAVVAIVVLVVGIVLVSSGKIKLFGNKTSSPCVVTLFGQRYDVTEFRKVHKGGDIYVCGTDMTQQYVQQHGNTPERVNQYLTPL